MGLSLAKRFGREGFEILMIARGMARLKGFEAELAELGIRSRGFACDLANLDTFRNLLRQLAESHLDLEVLIYNASAYNPATPTKIDLQVFENDLKVNVTGAVLAVQAFIPQMQERGQGAIFFTGGGTAFQAPASLASLGIGKAGIRSLAFTLAQECTPLGIHAATVTICGMIKPGTPFDPDLIADGYWKLYQQPAGEWETELMWS
jgi:NAD(P)-dependent dehydrogenase (short-subunit alcohol dehydrogenase family)